LIIYLASIIFCISNSPSFGKLGIDIGFLIVINYNHISIFILIVSYNILIIFHNLYISIMISFKNDSVDKLKQTLFLTLYDRVFNLFGCVPKQSWTVIIGENFLKSAELIRLIRWLASSEW